MDKAILAAWADPDRKRPSLPFRVRGEAQRADSGGAVLGEGTVSPLPTIYKRSLGDCCKLPQRGPARSHGR